MNRDPNGIADLERRLQALLEESVQRVGGRARSRLNQARHAALAEAQRADRWHPRRRLATRVGRPGLWVPAAGGLTAALLVAFVLWPHAPRGYPPAQASRATAQDLELLADRDGMELMQNGDGQFYEWAMAQADASGQPSASGAAAQGKAHGQSGDADTGRNSG
ncbi:MAG: hypothetical protein HIU85_07545 [Proteobacteria bacterium]|nr:hypothetical protein [Pseudomonadota bacterium]